MGKKYQILESNGEWADTHELMYSRFPEDKRRIMPTPAASTPASGDKGGEEAAGWDLDFIGEAVNHFMLHTKKELTRTDLGDIERKNYEGFLKKCIIYFQKTGELPARWQQSLPTEGRGVRWVNGGERVPELGESVFAGDKFSKFFGVFYKDGRGHIRFKGVSNYNTEAGVDAPANTIEWLDESSPRLPESAEWVRVEEEIGRLRGIIRNMWETDQDFEHNSAKTISELWQQFKTENNL